MPEAKVYDDLKQVLQEFKDFLDTNKQSIRDAIGPLKSIVPQTGEALSALSGLLGSLTDKISGIDVGSIAETIKQDIVTLLNDVTQTLQFINS